MGGSVTGISFLASDIRKTSLRGVMIELLSEGVEEVNGGQTEATAMCKGPGAGMIAGFI